MKRFRVRIVQEIDIEFDDDRATEKSARYVANMCWTERAIVGDSGISNSLGKWRTRLESAEVENVRRLQCSNDASW